MVVTGAARVRYAEIRKAHRAGRFDDPTTPEARRSIEKTVREHLDTPAFVFILCAVSEDSVRREEDYGATMMAIQNLLVAATADGIGTFLRTGGIMEHPDVLALVDAPAGYRIVGIVSMGYLASEVEPTPRKKPLNELIVWKD